MVLATYLINKDRQKATAQGRKEAYQRANEANAAYLQRMRAAQDAGELSNEPPPHFALEDEK